MSSGRFAAFRERADRGGADAAAAVEQFLLLRRRGQLLAPRRIAQEAGLGEDDVGDLLEIAAAGDVGVLERADVIECPSAQCGSREMLAPLLDQERVEGEARCSACEEPIVDPASRPAQLRYQLTEEADAEAEENQRALAARPQLTAVVLTALPEELAAVSAQLKAAGADVSRLTVKGGAIYYEAPTAAQHVDWIVYASFTEPTPASAAAGAADAILNFDPDIVVYLGIAGGIEKKGVKLGDVVAADMVLDYEIGKDTEEGFVSRTLQQHSAFTLKQLAGFALIDNKWRDRILPVETDLGLGLPVAHLEPIAAGGKVVASTKSATYELIRRVADRAVAVEMEGSGFLGAVHRYGERGIVIRGISDLIDGKTEADKAGVRKQAAANAAAFAFELLYSFEPAPG